jgi:hypothetical protein
MPGIDIDQFVGEAILLRHCAPIFFAPSPTARPPAIYANGTLALVDTGELKLVVTSSHVWDEFQKYKQEVPTACLCSVFASCWGYSVRLPEQPLYIDREIDLVVFEAMPGSWKMGCKEYYRVERWPIPKAAVKDKIEFMGFPGKYRETAVNSANFGASYFEFEVLAVSDRKIVSAGASDHRFLDNDDKEVPPIEMGGLSGSPGYVRDTKGRLSLVGFVQMGETSSDYLFLTHAAFLRRDGTLSRTLVTETIPSAAKPAR